MITYNEYCGQILYNHKVGIYKTNNKSYQTPSTVSEHINKFKMTSSHYMPYKNDDVSYIQITSPIRRLVDLLNMQLLCKYELNIIFSEEANIFYSKWFNDLDYINITTRYIRKLQSKCKLISIFEREQHKVFDGYVFDKIKRADDKYHYNIYLPELNIFSSLSLNLNIIEYTKHIFKLFMFKDESILKKKLKLYLVEPV